MHGLLDLDVTDATRLLGTYDPPLSFTAFVVAAVGRAVASHPEVQAYRNWLGQLIIHRHVDVSTIVEITTPQGPFPLVHTIRDADIRDVVDLSAELHRVKSRPFPRHRRASERLLPIVTRVPGLIRTLYALLSRSIRLRQRSGTVTVTAIGMFAEGGGFALAPLTLMSLQIVVGGITERPRVANNQVQIRKVLDLTVTIDHRLVDGGPAARFGAELRHQIESAQVLHPST
jgi:pyruvate/2-oxoglutarate dehydrogenase complex dihydrolipoamide acyltransferase (E2) component